MIQKADCTTKLAEKYRFLNYNLSLNWSKHIPETWILKALQMIMMCWPLDTKA